MGNGEQAELEGKEVLNIVSLQKREEQTPREENCGTSPAPAANRPVASAGDVGDEAAGGWFLQEETEETAAVTLTRIYSRGRAGCGLDVW